jgi:hypothetical protein
MNDKNNTRWTVTLEEDPATGDLVMPFPPELLAQVGWDYGDVLIWTETEHGSFVLSKKVDEPDTTVYNKL